MRHDEEAAPGDGGWPGRAREVLARNRLLTGYLLAAIIVKTAGTVLARIAYDGGHKGLFSVAEALGWLAFVIIAVGLAHWADQRVRAERAYIRAMRASADAAGVSIPGWPVPQRRRG